MDETIITRILILKINKSTDERRRDIRVRRLTKTHIEAAGLVRRHLERGRTRLRGFLARRH